MFLRTALIKIEHQNLTSYFYMLLLYLACDNWKYLGGDWRTIFWISKNTRTKDKSQKKTKEKYIKQNTKKQNSKHATIGGPSCLNLETN